jgi:signal peptidase II
LSISKTISSPSLRLHWLIMILLLGLDLGSKVWVRANVPLYEVTELITNFIDLTHVQNRGVSFSIFADIADSFRIPLLVGVSLVAVVTMIFYQTRYWNELDFYTRYGLVCVLPGAAGNLIDRAIYGYVTDFFHFRWYETSFFVNNLADCFISLGVVFFIIPLFFSKNDSHISKAT